MYLWRQLSTQQREEMLSSRIALRRPWHSPPNIRDQNSTRFLLTAACYEHKPYLFHPIERMDDFVKHLLECIHANSEELHAWVVLPNHYHFLVSTNDITQMLKGMKQLHGKTAYLWNKEEETKGRKIWCGIAETRMKTERHFWATLNYVLHNPVKHGYVKQWEKWPWSNARDYLQANQRNVVLQRWKEYPIKDYGKGWDDY